MVAYFHLIKPFFLFYTKTKLKCSTKWEWIVNDRKMNRVWQIIATIGLFGNNSWFLIFSIRADKICMQKLRWTYLWLCMVWIAAGRRWATFSFAHFICNCSSFSLFDSIFPTDNSCLRKNTTCCCGALLWQYQKSYWTAQRFFFSRAERSPLFVFVSTERRYKSNYIGAWRALRLARIAHSHAVFQCNKTIKHDVMPLLLCVCVPLNRFNYSSPMSEISIK